MGGDTDTATCGTRTDVPTSCMGGDGRPQSHHGTRSDVPTVGQELMARVLCRMDSDPIPVIGQGQISVSYMGGWVSPEPRWDTERHPRDGTRPVVPMSCMGRRWVTPRPHSGTRTDALILPRGEVGCPHSRNGTRTAVPMLGSQRLSPHPTGGGVECPRVLCRMGLGVPGAIWGQGERPPWWDRSRCPHVLHGMGLRVPGATMGQGQMSL